MIFKLDPQFAVVFAPVAEALAAATLPAIGDVASRRIAFEAFQRRMHEALPMPTDVVTQDFEAVAADGARLLLRWYVKTGSADRKSVV